MGVLFGDGAVCGPARVTQAVVRKRAVRTSDLSQELQIADGSDVFEAAVLAQREPRRVIAAVLEPLQAVEEQILGGATADVSDDPAHTKLLSVAAPFPPGWITSLQIRGLSPRTASRKRQKPG